MEMSDPFIDLCLGVQALRRTVEREIAGLGGATGVAAVPYPHQIANVQRVLTDSRIRHLISDEVGLGKTVQTLMVLNALRISNPSHRTLILVPENLAPQWLLECQSRGHFTPLDYPPNPGETGAHVRLAYYEQLRSVTEIDPTLYDLLIVDEIQRLQRDVRQRISDVAGEFRQLLLLSATPKLEDLQAFRQLLTILEPSRMTLAARTSDAPETILRDQEAKIAALIASGTQEQWAAIGFQRPEGVSCEALASTYSVLRRVTHTRRSDYPGLLPQRVLHRIEVEPTGDEVMRQEQVWKFIAHAVHGDVSIDLARLGQVALRSPRALSERINVLRGRDQRDPQGFLSAATRHLDLANGDSRLEALIDLLVEIWNEDPEEAVLVVAEDNPTVDYLERMVPQFLPEIGPCDSRRPLSVAIKRNRDTAATSDIVHLFDEYDESLGGFVDGDDQLLIAADLAQVGLNLQHARKLIFFSVPWSPMAVEQWIGRLDRLGSAALENQYGERNIDIYAIYHRGQVDERVVSILDDFEIFERSIRLDGDEINVVSQHIVDAALAPDSFDWRALSQEARAMANDRSDALDTPLSASLPWRPERTRALADYFNRVGALEPMLEHTDAHRAIARIETALRGWMRLIKRANGLRLWRGEDKDKSSRGFRLLHYYRSAYSTGPVEPRFLLPGLDPSVGQRYAYLDGRRSLESPPVTMVHVDGNPATPLNFLDHGDTIHDALVREWKEIGKDVPAHLELCMPEGHPLANEEGRGVYLVAILSWVPGELHLPELDRSCVLQQIQDARTRQEQKPLLDAIQLMEEELRADRFWLNSMLTARLDVIAARYADGGWNLVDAAVENALLTPWCSEAKGHDRILAKGQKIAPPQELKGTQSAGISLLRQEYSERHRRSLGECTDLEKSIANRRYLIEVEAEDLICLRQAQLDDAISLGLETSEQGFSRSRFRAIRNARDMAIHARDVRLNRFDNLMQVLNKPLYSEYKFATLQIV
ncbi:SNF2-related protein [Burkholderia cenocepacia]|uniref:SNF2-related protein n=1 Tax=Burkholderia cenocepacia TaxID=95486 RepID=UPI00286EE0B4|nr:SNF2-related protein [Burkholderia cenocepacia]